MNAIQLIHAYRHPQAPNVWVFDDERFGLVQEPFVFGASEAIDRIAAEIGAANRITLTFAATPMPKHHRVLKLKSNGEKPEIMGAIYHDGTAELWLCPAMMHYFTGPKAPHEIYVHASIPTDSTCEKPIELQPSSAPA